MQVKGRMLIVALVSFLPAVVLFGVVSTIQREHAAEDHADELLDFAQVASVEYRRWIDESRSILASLAEFPEVGQGGAACSNRLSAVMNHLPDYTTASLIGIDGYMVCGALGTAGSLYLGDRAYFRRAMATNRFAVGDYAVGRITGKPTVGVAQPLTTDDGMGAESVLALALDLDALGNQATLMNLPTGATFTVLDNAGTVMVRVREATVGSGADSVGSRAPDEFMEMVRNAGGATFETADLDGMERVLAVQPLRGAGSGPQGYLVVGANTSGAMAEVTPVAQMGLIILLAGLIVSGTATYLASRGVSEG